ncbi:MAG: hypothetical protein LBQ94_08225 [Treponema sp.]|jgi:hypothetical protein|nr:hypothetical protein [Treponema sp.]
MYTANISQIDNYHIITSINIATPDPEATQERVNAMIKSSPEILNKKTREELLEENISFSRAGSGQKNIDDTEGKKLYDLFVKLDPHEKLLISGDIIADWRDTEYWIKQSGVLEKKKIELIGEILPNEAVLPEELSQTQQQEIANQSETERIENLSPEQKTQEKEAALAAAKREVRYLKDEADIAEEPFDAKAEYQSRKAAIEQKYM